AAHWGYGWVFPKQQSFTIGVGGIHDRNPDLRGELASYLSEKGINLAEVKVKGQYIPFGDYRVRPGCRNVLLCGDAAGVVDPITGEGIAYAMQTGQLAAQAIIAARRHDNSAQALDLYLVGYRGIASSIRQANFWRRLIFPEAVHKWFAVAFSDAST